MRSLLLAAVINLLLAAGPAFACATASMSQYKLAPPARPYVLPDTQIRDMQSEETGAEYQLFIATPPDYLKSGKKYPVVYMLDADYSFALTRNIVRHLVDRKKLPEMILVGIAYPGAADDINVYKRNRTRDYTPTLATTASAGGANANAERGGAIGFRNFIADEVIPFISTVFPTNADRTFIGHSYGGLFGSYVLLTEPELFKRYIIVSPSLWYENRMIFRVEQRAAASPKSQRQIRRHAFFAIGSAETRKETGAPMVEELKQFYSKLESRADPGLSVEMRVFDGENHSSVFPGAVASGLLAVFGQPQS